MKTNNIITPVFVGLIFLIIACKQESKRDFIQGNHLSLQEMSKGHFKGKDADLYYRDWMKDIIEHRLFSKWLEAKRLVEMSRAKLDRSSLNYRYSDVQNHCNSHEDQLLENHPDLLKIFLTNQCIIDKIEDQFLLDIQEFKRVRTNFGDGFDFHLYVRLTFLSDMPEKILQEKLFQKANKKLN